MKLFAVLLLCVTMHAFAQDLPAGTRSVDDHSREDAARQQMRDAEAALEAGDYKSAEVQLQALAVSKPHDAHLQYDLGFVEERNGKSAEAAKAYAAAVAADGTLAEPKIALGLLDAREGRDEKAHAELLDAASLSNASPELRGKALRSMAAMDSEKVPEAAREELLLALKLTSETPQDIQMAGNLAEHAGDLPGAESAYRRALASGSGDVEAAAGLAHVLTAEGKTGEAEQVLTSALASHQDDPRLVARLATVYEAEGKSAEAIPLVQALLAKQTDTATVESLTRVLARLDSLSGKDAEAEKLYGELAAARPSDAGLLDDLGGAQVKQGKYAQAEATLSKAVNMRAAFKDDDTWGEAEGHLAFAAQKNNDPRTSLQAMSARATVLPDTAASLFVEATAHDSLHQTQEAIKTYRAFLSMASGKYPDQEFEARHRLIALEHEK